MRAYSAQDEERLHVQGLVREWTRSGLLGEPQRAAIEKELGVGVVRTNTMLRVGLALFTAIVVAASVLLIGQLIHVTEALEVAALTAAAGLACYGLAEWVILRFKLYRYGVEEMLAVAAVVLVAVGAAAAMPDAEHRGFEDLALVALAVGAAGGIMLYARFGFVYAAVGAMACLAAAPFQLPWSAAWRHFVAAAALACAGAIVFAKRRGQLHDFIDEEYAILQAAAFVGVYVMVNLKIFTPSDLFYTSAQVGRGFYWTTYALTWILPAAALWAGIREKERYLIDAGIATALATLVTNKPYLGLARRPWDPILLGVLLLAIAIVLRRWLLRGASGARRGFTPLRILASDAESIARLGVVTVAVPRPAPIPATPAPPPSGFSGGRSGGGGGGGEF